jgi:hypothetical protein
MNIDLDIDNRHIEESFDRIARELLNNRILLVNDSKFILTEIEFYYFFKNHHEDNYTHIHSRNSGEWRFHNQGLDITFQSSKESDGGILLRGLNIDNDFINGPRKVIRKIFEYFNKVTDENKLQLIASKSRDTKIIKTYRHLPNKQKHPDFHDKYYRYLTNLEKLEISRSEKERIERKSLIL